jgi:hypothetical protein
MKSIERVVTEQSAGQFLASAAENRQLNLGSRVVAELGNVIWVETGRIWRQPEVLEVSVTYIFKI